MDRLADAPGIERRLRQEGEQSFERRFVGEVAVQEEQDPLGADLAFGGDLSQLYAVDGLK